LSPSLPAAVSSDAEMENGLWMGKLEPRPSGGALNAALANELGKLIADFTGRGATRSRAFLHNDVVVCVLEDGATRAETNLVAAGRADLVRVQRDALQRAMESRLVAAVERLTGRTVRSFLSGMSTLGEDSVEVFVLEPLSSNGGSPAED
jgi:uncharacterized protein YbcI